MSESAFERMMAQRRPVGADYADSMVLRSGRNTEAEPVDPEPEQDAVSEVEVAEVADAATDVMGEEGEVLEQFEETVAEVSDIEAESGDEFEAEITESVVVEAAVEESAVVEGLEAESVEVEDGADLDEAEENIEPVAVVQSVEPMVSPFRNREQVDVETGSPIAEQLLEMPIPVPPVAPPQVEWTGKSRQVGFEAPGGTVNSRMPKVVVELLRRHLRAFGTEFADNVPPSQLLTGFMLSRLGISAEGFDQHTATVARLFGALEPQLAGIEQRLAEMSKSVTEMAAAQAQVRRGMDRAGDVMDTVALSNAFLITDRFETIAPLGSTGANIEVRHPHVLRTQENLERQAKAEREFRDRKPGVPIRCGGGAAVLVG